MNNKIILTAFIFFSLVVSADPLSDGKEYAKKSNSTVGESAKNPDPTKVPGYTGNKADEVKYYKLGEGIEDEALLFSTTDENSGYIKNAHNIRPNFEINKNTDPLFKREQQIVDLSRSLTDTYSGCVDLPVGTEDVVNTADKTCHIAGTQDTINFACTKYITQQCLNSNANTSNPYMLGDFQLTGVSVPFFQNGDIFSIGYPGSAFTGKCAKYTKTIRFYVGDNDVITDFRFFGIKYDDWLDITINDTLSFRAVGKLQGVDLVISPTFKCEQGKIYDGSPFDALSKIKKGWNTIVVENLVYDKGNFFFNFKLTRKFGCEVSDEVSYSCPSGESHLVGDLLNSGCIDSGWKNIGGIEIYRDCWSWSETFSRLADPVYVQDSTCGVIESEGCGLTTSVCLMWADGYCKDRLQTYSCSSVDAERHVELCASLLSCPDGDCAKELNIPTDSTEDFKVAAASLAVANELAKEFDPENLTVFDGQGMKCAKKAAGISNCCKGSGWATDADLLSCSAEEKSLGIKRELGAAYYVGKYCSQDSVLGCLETKHTYCTFPSKLSRLIIVQGNDQLSRDYGSAESPVCEGFTIEELKSLNFNQMDFSEFFDDVMNTAGQRTDIDPAALAKEIAEKMAVIVGE